ncbi:hypothetical protein [Pseudomonas syringae]
MWKGEYGNDEIESWVIR